MLHVPTVLGAVVVTYNLPELGDKALRSTAPPWPTSSSAGSPSGTTAGIAALNPGVKLPDKDIIVVHRSDGSGTSFIFTDFLSKVSPSWKEKVGSATSVEWPTGLGGKGNEGVTQQVKQSDGAIGYVELIYAVSNKLAYADVKNAEGQFVQPSLKSVTAAAASARAAAGHRLPGLHHQRRRAPTPIRFIVHLAAGPAAAETAPRAPRSRNSSSGCCSPRRSGWRPTCTTRRCRCR